LLTKAFDFDYSWPLHSALTKVLQGQAGAFALRFEWAKEATAWPRGSLHMRFSDNHDERRAIARFGEPAALAASVLMFTLDGVPMLYNGMEVGDTTESGAPALFEKLPVYWPIAQRRPEFPRFYKQMIALRRSSEALRRGSTVWLNTSDDMRVVSYARRAGNEEILVVINLSSRPFIGGVDVRKGRTFVDVTPDVAPPLPPDAPLPETAATKRDVKLPMLTLEAWSYRIYRRTQQ
jgi:glycosidase